MGNLLSSGTMICCSGGAAPGVLNVLPVNAVLSGPPLANKQDAKPLINIPTFGVCALGPPGCPCVPKTVAWTESVSTNQIGGAAAVDTGATASCCMGGKVSVIAPGQVPAQE